MGGMVRSPDFIVGYARVRLSSSPSGPGLQAHSFSKLRPFCSFLTFANRRVRN